MRLSLLRSPKAPDDTADMGTHHIKWAIMPHRGQLGAETVRAAFNYNNPMKIVSVSKNEKSDWVEKFPVVLRGDENLILDTIKRGEDDDDIFSPYPELQKRKGKSIIIRIYDSLGGRGRGVIETSWSVSKVFKTNLLEDDREEVEISEGKFEVEVGAFEVVSYRLILA